jgi:ankyrin repeat protein
MGILHGAARSGDLAAVNNELRRGTDANTPDKHGRRALVQAAGNGHIEIVKSLLLTGAEVDGSHIGGSNALAGEVGWTPLMAAARSGLPQVVTLLLQAGANVNARNVSGETILTQAITSGSVETIRLLLESGADPKAHTGDQSVWEWAKEEELDHANAVEILNLLKQAGATD